IIVPLRSETGVFDGVLVAEFRLDWLAERVLASQILTDVPTQALSVTLFDRLGRIEHSAPSDASGGAVVRELARQMSTGAATRTLVRAASASGEARIYALAALDAAKGIVLAVGLPESASVQRAEALRANSVVTLALLGVAILVLALRIGHITLVRPIRALAQHAQELAQGTAGGGQAPSDGPREVRDLGRELTALAAALTQRNRRLAAKNAELQRADRELKAFTYNASHGLQQPLDVLGGVLDAFARGERMSPANRDAVAQDARDALARIRRQLRETLLFSEVMRDDVGPDAGTALDLAELVRDVRSTLNDEMAGGEITVEPLPRIVAHAGLMKELFRHLLENAVVHAAPSPVRVRQGTRHDPEWIVVDIEDAGPGIAPEDQNTIFQPFRRVGQSTAGSGIGLSLAMRIAMRHGGHITLSSVPGQWATFHVHLPANLLVSRAAT
ncbi:MAG: HAMP domain-containing sensor histidine kinase, partial [Pseudomonadota bacterium]